MAATIGERMAYSLGLWGLTNSDYACGGHHNTCDLDNAGRLVSNVVVGSVLTVILGTALGVVVVGLLWIMRRFRKGAPTA